MLRFHKILCTKQELCWQKSKTTYKLGSMHKRIQIYSQIKNYASTNPKLGTN